jgi:hypothetical protein
MSIPMVTCAICNSQITKRSSLMIEPYGRICRSHPEVEQHKAKLADIADKATADKQLAKAMQTLQVISIVEGIRMMSYMKGLSLELSLFALSWKLPKEIRAEVEQKVRERGPITPNEFEEALMMAALLTAKKGIL